ncbi:bifunctional biotin--[acetyl-CoA-carboxylase] ligase/biotin operon repressor BirA [Lysobacter sp. F6437]|uniref:bifunctional biotin--[acetyl-CoA-carboxylase] ligase/biotin operon repressor BirA n=1 Tax=Lysobacter sp. F6437 TaxID=3459296 RepID=UPI00403DB85D
MDDRALLVRLARGPATGEVLADAGGQSRAAIWKRIEALREAGVMIDAKPGRGYALAQPLELLDSDAIAAALPPSARARAATVEVAWTVDSTNSELLRRPSAADGAATILLAERQTGGRGRRGREWASPLAAHVYLSVSRSFAGGLSRLGGLSLVAGIASVEALHAAGFAGVRLKWPNDLVVPAPDGGLRKLGGLLVEGGGEHAGPVRAVIGLGLNVRMPAASAARIDQPWCDLAGLADTVPSRNALAATLLERWLPALDEFDAAGLAPFLPRYAALDALAGQPVVVCGDHEVLAGTALGLAPDGALQVRLDDGDERSFHSGEVSVRRAGTAT